MRTSIRRWLASVGMVVGAGVGGAYGQAPKPMPMPMPMPMAPAKLPDGEGKGETVKPTITPRSNADLLPPVLDLAPPTGMPFANCNTCGDVNPNCADPGCAGDLIPGPKEPVWMSYSQLLLWFQPQRSPFNFANGNTVGAPSRVLLDGVRELGKHYGYKIDGGMWLNHNHTFGVGADGFITEHRSDFLTVRGGPGSNTIERPFFDVTTGQQTSLLVANAGDRPGPAFEGSVAQTVTARFASAGVNLRRNLRYDDLFQWDIFYGFRYYDLDESLVVYQRTVLPATSTIVRADGVTIPGGSTVQLRDRVYTRNQFWGGDLGGRFEYKHGMAFIALTPKVAFGSVHQITQVSGETRVTGAAPRTDPGALLAAGVGTNGNLGRYVVNRFALATDIGMQAGIALTKNARIALGYQFYYLNNVTRPSQQLDQAINLRNVPVSQSFGTLTGGRAPQVTFDREGFYAHGVTITMEARY